MTRREQLLLAIVAAAAFVGAAALYTYNVHGRPTGPVEEDPGPTVITNETPAKDGSAPVEPAVSDAPPLLIPQQEEDTPTVAVSVMGAVKRPGMYAIEVGGRVQDLVDAAGGVTEDADVSDVNMAAPLLDGTTLTVPVRPVTMVAEGTIVARRGQTAAELNPPQYTISGWRSGAAASAPAASGNGGGARTPASSPAAAASGLINLNTATQEQLESLPGIGEKLAQEIINYRTHTRFNSVEDLDNVSGIGTKRLAAIRDLVTAP